MKAPTEKEQQACKPCEISFIGSALDHRIELESLSLDITAGSRSERNKLAKCCDLKTPECERADALKSENEEKNSNGKAIRDCSTDVDSVKEKGSHFRGYAWRSLETSQMQRNPVRCQNEGQTRRKGGKRLDIGSKDSSDEIISFLNLHARQPSAACNRAARIDQLSRANHIQTVTHGLSDECSVL